MLNDNWKFGGEKLMVEYFLRIFAGIPRKSPKTVRKYRGIPNLVHKLLHVSKLFVFMTLICNHLKNVAGRCVPYIFMFQTKSIFSGNN